MPSPGSRRAGRSQRPAFQQLSQMEQVCRGDGHTIHLLLLWRRHSPQETKPYLVPQLALTPYHGFTRTGRCPQRVKLVAPLVLLFPQSLLPHCLPGSLRGPHPPHSPQLLLLPEANLWPQTSTSQSCVAPRTPQASQHLSRHGGDGLTLDLRTLEVFSNLNDSMIPPIPQLLWPPSSISRKGESRACLLRIIPAIHLWSSTLESRGGIG